MSGRWAAIVFGGVLAHGAPAAHAQEFRVLVLTTAFGYQHASIPAGVAAVEALGARHCFAVEATADPAQISASNLARFDVVMFLLTTGDILSPAQEAAFEAWFTSGRGWVGVHSAADTEHGWPFYGQMLGAYFVGHPPTQGATVIIADPNHPSTAHLPNPWFRFDEWYNFSQVPAANILLRLDESTYSGGTMGTNHPIAWYREVSGGRMWYTGGGHTSEAYSEPLFMRHVLGGVEWAAGKSGCACYADCDASGTLTIADFGCFQAAFAGNQMYADCNSSGSLTIADFGCFQGAFAAGCP